MAHSLSAFAAVPWSAEVTIRVCIRGLCYDGASAIRYLLYPYRIEFVDEMEKADLAICRDRLDFSKPMIRLVGKRLPSEQLGMFDHGNGVVDLPYDLLRGCSERFKSILKPRVALAYRLATQSRLQYNVIPSPIRNALLRSRSVDSNLSFHLANETVRKALRHAFRNLGFELERRNPFLFLMTHDVESEKGLNKALSFKRIDDELGVRSTWFITSDEYPISKTVARELSEGSTIGSHDVRHDGRLMHIRQHQALVERLRTSRLHLERTFDKEVRSFRAPLLQFSENMIFGLGGAGYRFDFSVPCWEPIHPATMGGFGIEAVQSFEMHGVIEFPLTLFQDHQVLSVLGMSTREAVKLWTRQARLVREFDGDIVVLVHPDYAFSQDLRGYRDLLTSLLEVHTQCIAS